jgi:hypothetical protein
VLAATSAASIGSKRSGSSAVAETAAYAWPIRSASYPGSPRDPEDQVRGLRRQRLPASGCPASGSPASGMAIMLPACCAICPPSATWFGRIAALNPSRSRLT